MTESAASVGALVGGASGALTGQGFGKGALMGAATSAVMPVASTVAMGGYNTFCEMLSFDKRALIVLAPLARCAELQIWQVGPEQLDGEFRRRWPARKPKAHLRGSRTFTPQLAENGTCGSSQSRSSPELNAFAAAVCGSIAAAHTLPDLVG